MIAEPADDAAGGASPGEEDRQGIFGGETEYAVLYIPDDPASAWMPSFEALENVLFQALLEGRKSAASNGLKGGFFLENGGLIHMEIYLRTQADTPIIEASTPECRSPRDLIVYQRAFDRILAETSRISREHLRARGFGGRIGFGKSNLDARGIGFGCHENYFVHQKTGLLDRALVLLAAPLVALLLLPAVAFVLAVLTGVLLSSAFSRWFPRLTQGLVSRARRAAPLIRERGRAAYFITMNTLLFIPILLYSAILRRTAFRPFRRDLTPFLVTRQIMTGSGRLDPREGVYEISQRPRLTTSLAEIVMFGRHKTVYDLKGLLYDPLALFRSRRKLTVTVGDSNLSDVPLLLSTGTTALVIEMIEAGVRFDDLRLRRPLRALRDVSRGGPWKELEVARPEGAATVRRPAAPPPWASSGSTSAGPGSSSGTAPRGGIAHREILELWEEVLEDLAESPARLADRLDWAAKKSILDTAVLARGTWPEFLSWCRVLSRAPGEVAESCGSLEELLARAGPFGRLRLRPAIREALARREIDPARFEEARDLYLAARKIDLRYHEIGDDPGYQRQLEGQGLYPAAHAGGGGGAGHAGATPGHPGPRAGLLHRAQPEPRRGAGELERDRDHDHGEDDPAPRPVPAQDPDGLRGAAPPPTVRRLFADCSITINMKDRL